MDVQNCFKWANYGLFKLIFALFKQYFVHKTVGYTRMRNQIVGVTGKHADHCTMSRIVE